MGFAGGEVEVVELSALRVDTVSKEEDVNGYWGARFFVLAPSDRCWLPVWLPRNSMEGVISYLMSLWLLELMALG